MHQYTPRTEFDYKMKYFSYSPILGIIALLASCSEEVNTPAESNTEIPIEISTSANDFIPAPTRANEEDVDGEAALYRDGFVLCAFQREAATGLDKDLFFISDYWYDEEQSNWITDGNQSWPDETTSFNFYAFSPYISEEQIKISGNSTIIEFDENQLYGDHDMLLAVAPNVSSSTNNGEVALEFKHIVTKLSFSIAFCDDQKNPYEQYYAILSLYSDNCKSYEISSNKWIVIGQLPAGFTAQDIPNSDVGNNFTIGGSTDLYLEPSVDADNLIYQEVGVGYVIPQKYYIQCDIIGMEDNVPTALKTGYFELDLTGKAGSFISLKVNGGTLGGDGLDILEIQTTEEEITAID